MTDRGASIFICHSSADLRLATDIVTVLERAGHTCWIAPRDVTAGESYAGELARAIRNAEAVIVLVTESSTKSEHVLREIEMATRHRHRVIPVCIGSVTSDEMDYYLGFVHQLHIEAADAPQAVLQQVEAAMPKKVTVTPPPQKLSRPPAPAAPPVVGRTDTVSDAVARQCRYCGHELAEGGMQQTGHCPHCRPDFDPAVYELLRAWRLETSRASLEPAYTVFTNATLEWLAATMPRNLYELSHIPGVGRAKQDKYGSDVFVVLEQARAQGLGPREAVPADVPRPGCRVNRQAMRDAAAQPDAAPDGSVMQAQAGAAHAAARAVASPQPNLPAEGGRNGAGLTSWLRRQFR